MNYNNETFSFEIFRDNAKVITDWPEHLRYAMSHINNGYALEFGVFKGKSLKNMSTYLKDQTVYGFDSFKGFPEDWVYSKTGTCPKNYCELKKLPIVDDNVKLVIGWFDETLPTWLEIHPGEVAFLHIDCDIYSSTKTVLTLLNDRIVKGTVIAFDEICNWDGTNKYTKWREGEWKALHEWMSVFDREISVLARTTSNTKGSIIVRK